MFCDTFTTLYNQLQSHQLPVAPSDIVRVACCGCQRVDVCAFVDFDEFDVQMASSKSKREE